MEKVGYYDIDLYCMVGLKANHALDSATSSQLIRTHTDEYINWCVPLIFKKISRQHLHEDGLF